MSASDQLPLESLERDLDHLEELLDATVKAFQNRMTAHLEKLRANVTKLSRQKKIPSRLAHDIRDMTMLVRSLKIHAAKGRRRDLKKLETTLEDLMDIAKSW